MNLLNALNHVLEFKRTASLRDREKGLGGKSTPSLEHLESLCLLSTIQTITEPPISVASMHTNFGIGPDQVSGPAPFTPSLPLFNPALGTLVAVHITGEVDLSSQIGAENLSLTSPATITSTASGNYQVDGLGQTPFTGTLSNQQQFDATTFDGTIDYAGTSGHTFSSTSTTPLTDTLTSPSELSFFTATTGHTSITPTMSADADTTATAPGGNLAVEVVTRGDAASEVTVSYDYIPTPPPPSVVSVVRYGVHREHTQIIVTFSGNVDPVAAANVNNYQLVHRGADGQFTPNPRSIIPIQQVVYNADSNTATIVPVKSFNFRNVVQLTIKAPVFGANGTDYHTVFGGASSLGGFIYHHSGRFFSVNAAAHQVRETTPPPGFLMGV